MSADTLPGLDAPSSDATISADGLYRYELTRMWDPAVERIPFVMLNPSTADASIDDPTIRRCVAFARRHDYGGITVLNLYAFRATDPRALRDAADPIGPDNNATIIRRLASKRIAVAAWGAHADVERARDVMALAPHIEWVCLGKTKSGAPRHPLYVRGDRELEPFNGDAPDRWLVLNGMGGYVCAACGDPVESEPCRHHQPAAYEQITGIEGSTS